MPVGGGDNLEKDAQKRDYGNAIVLSKFELDDPQRFRFIEYVGISRRVFWPYLDQNAEGEFETKWWAINRPPYGTRTVIDDLENADKRAYHRKYPKADMDKFRSQFSHSQKFIFLAFDRKDTEPIVHRVEVPYSVRNAISDFNKEVSDENKSKLANGPFWFYDIKITAYEKKDLPSTVPSYYKRAYNVKIVKNQFEDTISVEASDTTSAYYKEKAINYEFLVKKGVFTEEEVEAMKTFDAANNVKAEIAPTSPEDIEKLIKEDKQIYLNATRGGVPIWDYIELMAEEFTKIQIEFNMAEAAQGQLSAPPGCEDDAEPEEAPPLDKAKEIKADAKVTKEEEEF